MGDALNAGWWETESAVSFDIESSGKKVGRPWSQPSNRMHRSCLRFAIEKGKALAWFRRLW